MARVSHKLSNAFEGALAGGGDPASSPLYVFGPFLKLIVVAGVAQVTFGASVWLVVLTVALVAAMYRLVMIWIVDGSGGSGLGEEEFGGWAVKINASITMIEYTLTFLVSMAALVTFIADRATILNSRVAGVQYRTFVAIFLSLAAGWLVNRGPKMAARTFGPATAGLLILLWAMIIATVWRYGLQLPDINLKAFGPGYLPFTLGGYARILALMTGIEIFANLVAAYKGPAREKSRMAFNSLLLIMGTTSLTMLIVGPAILKTADPANLHVSVFTQTMDRLLPAPLAVMGTFVGVLVLLSACAASAQGVQNLALGLKLRHYIPAYFGQRNQYEVADKPVWIQVLVVSFCFLLLGTHEETYLALYAAGVFILLSMTAWAAVRRLFREMLEVGGWYSATALAGVIFAALLTTAATVIIFVERLTAGVWAYFVLIPALYLIFSAFRSRLGVPETLDDRLGRLQSEARYLQLPDLEIQSQSRVMFRHVAIALDGSPFAELGLPYARLLCRPDDATLTLISVSDQEARSMRSVGNWFQGSGNNDGFKPEMYLQGWAGQLNRAGINAQMAVVAGPVAEKINAITQDRAVDVLVITTHGHSDIGRVVRGSKSSKVIELSSLPILIVRPAPRRLEREPVLERILVGLDGSRRSENTLPYVTYLARYFDSEVLVLSVPEDDSGINRLEDVESYLHSVVQRFARENVRARSIVTGAEPAYTIVQAAEDEKADLIVVATNSRHGMSRLMLGNVADLVVQNTNRPVLLIPTRARN